VPPATVTLATAVLPISASASTVVVASIEIAASMSMSFTAMLPSSEAATAISRSSVMPGATVATSSEFCASSVCQLAATLSVPVPPDQS